MFRRLLALAGAFSLTFIGATAAAAQTTDPGRWFVNVNLAIQTGDYGAATNFTGDTFQETATISISQTIKSGPIFDVTAGLVSLKGPFGLAANMLTWKRSDDGIAEATVPHPIFYDQSREVSGTLTAMRHEETWVTALATWRKPLSQKVDLMLMGGPALAFVLHEVPTEASVTETSAGPDVHVTLVTEEKQLWGYQVGGDIRYALTKMIGVGGFARVTGASGHIRDVATLELGGFSAGGGVRLRF
jgi:hypothetical protein